MKLKIFNYKRVKSTNDTAIMLIKKGKEEMGCVYANIQTKGRGTHGKKWISNKGNLFSSVFFPLKKNYPTFNEFSIINPVIISQAISSYCDNKKMNLKFPNDILLNKKKICGILQEVIQHNYKNFLIIGIGLNIESSPKIKKGYQTTSLWEETKKKHNIKEVVKKIITYYEKFFSNLSSYNYLNFKKKANLMVFKQ